MDGGSGDGYFFSSPGVENSSIFNLTKAFQISNYKNVHLYDTYIIKISFLNPLADDSSSLSNSREC